MSGHKHCWPVRFVCPVPMVTTKAILFAVCPQVCARRRVHLALVPASGDELANLNRPGSWSICQMNCIALLGLSVFPCRIPLRARATSHASNRILSLQYLSVSTLVFGQSSLASSRFNFTTIHSPISSGALAHSLARHFCTKTNVSRLPRQPVLAIVYRV